MGTDGSGPRDGFATTHRPRPIGPEVLLSRGSARRATATPPARWSATSSAFGRATYILNLERPALHYRTFRVSDVRGQRLGDATRVVWNTTTLHFPFDFAQTRVTRNSASKGWPFNVPFTAASSSTTAVAP